MKMLTLASFLLIAVTEAPFAESSLTRDALESAGRVSITLDPGRPLWPIVREASGHWEVVGEGVARHRGRSPVAVRSVTFIVQTSDGHRVLDQVFDTPETLGEILLIARATSSGAPDWKPAGTTVLDPGDTGVAFLSGLTEPWSVPVRAFVTMRFSRGPARTFAVPLQVFNPGQRMGWPSHLDSEPWLATNTAGTTHHWVGGAVMPAHALFISQRFAIDLLQVDVNGGTHPASATGKEAYYAWGEQILSAGRGTVVAVVSDQHDLEIGESPSPADHPAGNFVVIQHGPDLFGIYAHMQQASAVVSVGDWIERGHVIGLVGNSGSSTQPHLHIHFTDAWPPSTNPMESFTASQGVPAVFWGAQVYRNGAFFNLRGGTPFELDVITARRSKTLMAVVRDAISPCKPG